MLTGSAFRSSKSPMKPPMRFRRHAQAKIVRVGTGFVKDALRRLDAAAATQ